MRPAGHIIASFSLGAGLWFFTGAFYAGMICFVAGVFIDIDHVIEYIIHHGLKGVSFKKICLACEQTTRQEGEYKFERLYLFFHTGEIIILLWIALVYIKNIYLLAFALGATAHIILDAIVNVLKPQSYFITFRIREGFNTARLIRKVY